MSENEDAAAQQATPSLDEIIEGDAKRVETTRKWLTSAAPDIRAGLNEVWKLFDDLADALSAYTCTVGRDDRRRSAVLRELLGMRDGEALTETPGATSGMGDAEALAELRTLQSRELSLPARA